MKDELGRKTMTELAALRPKIYSYLIDDSYGNKKAKVTKKFVTKQKVIKVQLSYYIGRLLILFRSNSTWKDNPNREKIKVDVDILRENHNKFIKNINLILKSQKRFRNEKHNVFTEEVNKTELTNNNNKWM